MFLFEKSEKCEKKLYVCRHPKTDSRKLKVTLQDNAADWSFRDSGDPNFNPYFSVFILWSKKRCGMDFLRGFTDGRLSYDIMDQYQATGLTLE